MTVGDVLDLAFPGMASLRTFASIGSFPAVVIRASKDCLFAFQIVLLSLFLHCLCARMLCSVGLSVALPVELVLSFDLSSVE